MIEFQLKDTGQSIPYIELNKLLKATQACESGAMANQFILEGIVTLNGKIESRKRAKIRQGDVVQVDDLVIKII